MDLATTLIYVNEWADFSQLLQSLNLLFLEAKSFNFFFIAVQEWVDGNFHKVFSISFASSYLLTQW